MKNIALILLFISVTYSLRYATVNQHRLDSLYSVGNTTTTETKTFSTTESQENNAINPSTLPEVMTANSIARAENMTANTTSNLDNKTTNSTTKPQNKTANATTIPQSNTTAKTENTTAPKVDNSTSNISDVNSGANKDDPTANEWNCNSKGRCWMWCGDKDRIAAAKNDFHKQTDGKWCYTTAEISCKTRDDCKTQSKCVDNCSARWGQ